MCHATRACHALGLVLLFAGVAACQDKVARSSPVLQALGVPMPMNFSKHKCGDDWKHREPSKTFDSYGYCPMPELDASVFLNWKTGDPIAGERWFRTADSTAWARFSDSTTAAMQTIASLQRCTPPGASDTNHVRYAQRWTLRNDPRAVTVHGSWRIRIGPEADTSIRPGEPGIVWIVVHQGGAAAGAPPCAEK